MFSPANQLMGFISWVDPNGPKTFTALTFSLNGEIRFYYPNFLAYLISLQNKPLPI